MKRTLLLSAVLVVTASLTAAVASHGPGASPAPLVLLPVGTVIQLNGAQGYAVPYSSTFSTAASGHLVGSWVADHGIFWVVSPADGGIYNPPALLAGPASGSLNATLSPGTWSVEIVHGQPANVTVTQTVEVLYG